MAKVDRHVWAPVFLVLSLAACRGDTKPSDVMAREKFVAANVAVRTLPANATDADRAAALKKQRVTEKQMQAWVNAHARDAETLSITWEEIAKKVDSLTTHRPGSTPDSAGGGPPPSLGGPPTIAPQSVRPAVRPRKDSLANIAPGARRPGFPRPGGPPLRRPPSEQVQRIPPPSALPQDPRIAPVQAPVAPARPAKPPR
ncbi:hypothetical protein [Longimicrobium sp.]|jgi:hypothetical protein|uniref:hypothetical protein n=1 Tax=Longimicrobium sp. TaxID=2029185 RepID=UPI002F93AC28